MATIARTQGDTGRSHPGMEGMFFDSDSMCLVLDDKPNRLFHWSRVSAFECLDTTASRMYAEPVDKVNNDLFFDRLAEKQKSFLDEFCRWWCQARSDGDSHETFSVLKVHTTQLPPGVCVCSQQMYLRMSLCVKRPWDALVRAMADGGGGCMLESFHPIMVTVRASAGVLGVLDGCDVVLIDTWL